MLKNKVLGLLREFIDEWLLGFDDKDFEIGLFKNEKINL